MGQSLSPDGKVLVGGLNKGVGVWSVGTGELLGAGPVLVPGRVTDLAFSPDGEVVAAGWDETDTVANVQRGGVSLIPVGNRALAALVERIANRNLTRAEWREAFPDGRPYCRTFPNLPEPPDDPEP